MSDQLEPSPEIKEFLQQIASHQQYSQGRQLGGFSEAASAGEEGDSSEVMGQPGSSVMTEVWAKRDKGIWTTSKIAASGFTKHFAEWKFPTVSLWKRLGSSRQSPFTQERKLWKVFLVASSLTRRPLTFSNGLLSAESFRDILQFSPPVIPTTLVRMFLKTTTLSQQEISRIERECMTLWRQEGGSIKNPHPLLEEVINAMNLYERFGIQTWPSLNDLPVKTYTVLRKAMEVYSISMSMNMKEDSVRRHAAEMAGLRPPTGR